MDISQNMIDNQNINPDYYRHVINDLCKQYLFELYPDEKKISSNHLLAVMRHIYDHVFKPDKTTFYNLKCNIPYNENNITTLYNIYIQLYADYLCFPSMYSFSVMTGLDESTIEKYVTAVKSELLKSRKEFIQNKLSDNPIGVVTLANNDQDTGLLYNRQNMIEKETIKQGLTLNDFVKISDKSSK